MREESVTRLTIDLPSEMHRLIKAKASLQNLTIKDFVIRAIKKDADSGLTSKNNPNKKTAAALKSSMKNSDKLKSFKNSDEAMEWLLAEGE